MKQARHINQKGFTLVEILIAIIIFATIISILYSSYTGTLRNIKETQYQADIYHMARVAIERMVEDLESVYISQFVENFCELAVTLRTDTRHPHIRQILSRNAQSVCAF